MKIDIVTLFPEMFKGPFDQSIIKRACDSGLVQIEIHNLRKWTNNKRQTVDNRPFGGGVGMVMMVEPIDRAVQQLRKTETRVILMTPQGKPFKQKMAFNLSKEKHLVIICGHYEGVDERIRQYLVDEEISIGDYVLTGGEIPAMVIIDSVVRLVPGCLGKAEAVEKESFSDGNLLEYPQYTQPADYKAWKVPEVLLSGNHQRIEIWRREEATKRTALRRPDLLRKNKG